ncbi:CxC2 domain-containing protein [Mycena indigotica]|uniref:CxC2 domain-containing protein n=1 Tax=Mycena indigotica TaxID=2126181 RepID=A0A8H6VP32_9AGAR|nr:CxC2 domain-containing protein [Mycena indigotica]KAF7288449.1 CxC2 domain-containing protein [Mycena indigotica]
MTAYDYYSTLESLTDGLGINPPDRHSIFLRISRQYRHLRRDGNWAGRARPQMSRLSAARSTYPNDGKMLLQETNACASYHVHCHECLLPPQRPNEPRPWSWNGGLAALDRANSKFSRGYSVTGVGMGGLRKGTIVLPNGVGDLQAGERYSNLDCIFASFMRRLNSRLPKLISYDIVWQNAHQRSLDPVPNPVFSTLHSRFGQAHASVDLALDGINFDDLELDEDPWTGAVITGHGSGRATTSCPISLTQSLRVVGKRRMQNVQTELDKAGAVPIRDVSLTKFITALLDAETDQRRIRGLVDLRKTVATSGRNVARDTGRTRTSLLTFRNPTIGSRQWWLPRGFGGDQARLTRCSMLFCFDPSATASACQVSTAHLHTAALAHSFADTTPPSESKR